MPQFAYTVVVDRSGKLEEISGVMEGRSVHEVILKLIQRGYIVREVRNARPDDLQIEKLRKFKNHIAGSPTSFVEPPLSVRRSWRSWWFAVVIFVLLVLYLFLESLG